MAAVVDTGIGNDATRALWERIIAEQWRPIASLLTHYHPDHVGNASWLPRASAPRCGLRRPNTSPRMRAPTSAGFAGASSQCSAPTA